MTRFEQEWAVVPDGARWTAALVCLLVAGLTGSLFLLPGFVERDPKAVIVLTVIHASRDIPSRLAELQPSLLAEVELLRRKLPRGEARKRRR